MNATQPGTGQARVPSPALLMQIGLAYRSSAVLFAAVNLDIFTILSSGPRAAQDLATACKAHLPAMQLLLNACVVEGLLVVDGDCYSNSEVAAGYLARTSPEFSANGFKYAENLYPAWGRLTDLLREGRPPMPAPVMLGENKEVTRAFVMAMHERARGIGSILPYLDLTGREHLLDVGGGPGTYSVALVEKTPGLRATVLDVPGVVEVAQELVSASGHADRVQLRAGDYLTSDFGTGYDAALLSGMMHRESPDSCRLLLRKTWAALDTGGVAIVSDVFFDDETKRTPPFTVYFALNMMLTSDEGSAHAKTEMTAWLREAGFTDVQVRELPKPNAHSLVIGRKP
jgi:cyclopropane fatty-acyl-phospholipid synthase-like methyltransferase